jgi:two-component system, cell cycle response regulator CpdR
VGQAFTVLFVDDDGSVRDVFAAILSSRGFRVRAAESGYAAMRILAQEHVDVLFADIVMPDLDGIELAKQAKLMRPDLRVILVTGYYSRAREAETVGKLLFKPLRADHIEAEIRAVLRETH